jgi:outer membrane protein OmpA-like peptidoglycan-associated protein
LRKEITVKKIKYVWITAVVLFISSGLAIAALPDKKGCVDHPLFPTRMPGYSIADCDAKDFDTFNFETGKKDKAGVEGRRTKLTYKVEDRSKEPSGLAVVRNYENAIKSVRGTVLFIDKNSNRFVNGKIVKDGNEIWAQAEKGNGVIWLTIVEKAGMAQDIVANADAFGNDIKSTGHATIYGIYFDTGKSEVKAESQAALEEVAKLLSSDPDLKLLVVGHTDSVGQLEANMKLSQARAEAVVQALTRSYGVAATRLKAIGAGPIAPVVTNRTEEGRAKNRRVELVEQ